MDALSFLRTMGALSVVLGLLAGGLWVVHRYEIRLPQKWLSGFPGTGGERRLNVVERLVLDPRRSLLLIRKDGAELTLLIAPEGVLQLETANPPEKSDA